MEGNPRSCAWCVCAPVCELRLFVAEKGFPENRLACFCRFFADAQYIPNQDFRPEFLGGKDDENE